MVSRYTPQIVVCPGGSATRTLRPLPYLRKSRNGPHPRDRNASYRFGGKVTPTVPHRTRHIWFGSPSRGPPEWTRAYSLSFDPTFISSADGIFAP